MATEANKFQVGAFVIAATVIGVGAAIWLGASRFFEKTERFVTYFSESVQGLDPGSAVKYRGVPSGHVNGITIAPDGNLIAVIMDIDRDSVKYLKGDESLRAQLQLSGITGLRYIEIEPLGGEALRQSPILSFQPPYPVIPSARSSFKAIQSALGDIYDRFMELDLGGISSAARTVLGSANDLLRDPRIPTVLSNLKTASESAGRLTATLETRLAALKLDPIVENSTQASLHAKEFFGQLNDVTAKQLNETATHLNQLTQSAQQVAQNAQQVLMSMQYTLDRLDRAVGNFRALTEDVRQHPSSLLFSSPPEVLPAPDGANR